MAQLDIATLVSSEVVLRPNDLRLEECALPSAEVLVAPLRNHFENGCRLQQAKLAGAGDRLGAALNQELVEDALVVALHRAQREEEPLADLLV